MTGFWPGTNVVMTDNYAEQIQRIGEIGGQCCVLNKAQNASYTRQR